MMMSSDSERSRSSSSSSYSAPSSPGRRRICVPVAEHGAPCLKCGEQCEGLLLHVWRKICINCNCPRELHKATDSSAVNGSSAIRRDSGVTLSDYTWFPNGISPEMVKLYMDSLPPYCVPLRGSVGDSNRSKLYMKQFPSHDSDPELCHNLSDIEKKRLVKIYNKFKSRASGVGTVHLTGQPVGPAKICAQCNQKIEFGHIYIMAAPFTGQTWHSTCFTCTTCNDMLVDLMYYFNDKDNHIYCGRHYAEAMVPRCSGCDELIVAETYTNAEDKTWHKEHFCCQMCDKPLMGEKYIPKDDLILCASCSAPDCHRCHLPISIDQKQITKGLLKFHEHCFVCKRCKEKLQDGNVYYVEDDYLCNECIQPISQCFSCKRGILPTEKHLKHESRAWHVACFDCSSCKRSLIDTGFHDYAGSIFCEDCYNIKTKKKCNKCHKPIESKGIQFNFCIFHPECFKCSQCHSELREKITEKEGRLYCSNCSLKFAKICRACQEPIISRHTVHNKHIYHLACFKCTQCGYPIGKQNFYETSLNDVLCEPCAGRNI